MKRRERMKNWIKKVLSTTPEERIEREARNTLKRMAQVNVRTYTGTTFINRNDPCYCGNTYEGLVWLDKHGNAIRDKDGKVQDKPVKFKHCCMKKHVGLRVDEMTPALAESQKKQQDYFDKYGRLI